MSIAVIAYLIAVTIFSLIMVLAALGFAQKAIEEGDKQAWTHYLMGQTNLLNEETARDHEDPEAEPDLHSRPRLW